MKIIKRTIFLLGSLFSVALLINAQTEESKIALGLNFVRNEYNGDYGNGIFNFNQPWYIGGGLSLSTYLNHSFDLGLQESYGRYGYTETNANQFEGTKIDLSLFTHYKLDNGYIFKKESKLSPFISLGVGFVAYAINNSATPYPTIITKGNDLILPVGAGLKYQFTRSFAIQYQYLYTFTNADNHDENRGPNFFGSSSHPKYKSGNDAFGEHSLSLVFSFGNSTCGCW